MKYCTKCGYQLTDGSRFCNACGTAVCNEAVVNAQPLPSDENLRAEEQALLDKFSLGLKHERLAWKIVGIVFLISTILIAVCALIIGICAIAVDDYSGETAFIFSTFANTYFIMALTYLPIVIINFAMKKKVESYREKLYTDCRDGFGHYSVGSIVFSGFFNSIAMIFIIIYFVQAKQNADVIERIKARQDSFNSQQ